MDLWNRKRKRRWVRRTVLVTAALSASFFLILAVAVEWKPAWYGPALVDDGIVRRAKLASAELVEFVGNGLVAGQLFDVTLAQSSINEFAAALPALWPEAAERIPRGFSQPALAFDAGSLRAGFLAERFGWRAILSAEVTLEVRESSDDIILTLHDVGIGAVGVPRTILRAIFDDRLRAEAVRPHAANEMQAGRGRADSTDALFRGVAVRNRFVWPNGRRPFRIEKVSIDEGEATIQIRPL